jgi:ABC-2 type transport system permease protein
MQKIWLVIKREYLTRVRNKTFILSTILLPLFFIGFIIASTYLSVNSVERHTIAVNDENGLFRNSLKSDEILKFEFTNRINENNFSDSGFSAYLKIPSNFNSKKESIIITSDKSLGLAAEDKIRAQINTAIRNRALLERNIDKSILDSINNVDEDQLYTWDTRVKKGDRVEASNSGLAYGIGFGSGILIYITLFVYGAMVMRGVMEEKTTRIAEVIVTSVKPFQLMMGKIIGIAGVGLTQLLMWLVLIMALSTAATAFISPEGITNAQQLGAINKEDTSVAMGILSAKETFVSANWALIIPCFLFYFIGGYLFYAALFAAVGSMVNEDPQEAQSLMLPITMPIILSFIIMSTAAAKPDTPLAVWASIIPFSSSIVMMARIPSGNVPPIELITSMAALIIGFLLTTWLAAKIYRTGILMYGKKVTFREVGRWLIRKS